MILPLHSHSVMAIFRMKSIKPCILFWLLRNLAVVCDFSWHYWLITLLESKSDLLLIVMNYIEVSVTRTAVQLATWLGCFVCMHVWITSLGSWAQFHLIWFAHILNLITFSAQSKEECEYLINLATPHMRKSTVVDSDTGKSKDSRCV